MTDGGDCGGGGGDGGGGGGGGDGGQGDRVEPKPAPNRVFSGPMDGDSLNTVNYQ